MAISRLIHIGFGNIVNADKIIAIVSPDSAPVRRLVSQARNDGRTIDATQGRKTKSVLVMENDRIVLSALLPETIRGRALSEAEGKDAAPLEPAGDEEEPAEDEAEQAEDEAGTACAD